MVATLVALVALLATKRRPASSSSSLGGRHSHLPSLHKLRTEGGVLWIDLENVRGKSGFAMDHVEVLERTSAWCAREGLGDDRVIVAVDHGSRECGYGFQRNLAVVFAGPSQKADDVIAKGVGLLKGDGGASHQVVVTADSELISRCRRAARGGGHGGGGSSLTTVNPLFFLQDLETLDSTEIERARHDAIADDAIEDDDNDTVNGNDDEAISDEAISDEVVNGNVNGNADDAFVNVNGEIDEKVDDDVDEDRLRFLNDEIRLRGELLDVNVRVGKKGRNKNSKKKRSKLKQRANRLRERIARLRERHGVAFDRASLDDGSSFLKRVTAVDGDGGMSVEEQNALLSRWPTLRSGVPRKEKTGDRVVLAERLRRRLAGTASAVDATTTTTTNGDHGRCESPVRAFLRHANRRFPGFVAPSIADDHGPPASASADLLREQPFFRQHTTYQILKNQPEDFVLDNLTIVAISDTHGMEDQLPDLPDGDLLLHLGDFATDEVNRRHLALQRFDAWLSRQPHPYKIVVRGNHDPKNCGFPSSGAWYVTEPARTSVAGTTLAIVPHGAKKRNLLDKRRSPVLSAAPPDVLATHHPPHKTKLDRTLDDSHAGDALLSYLARAAPPRVWFCGHIHEGRGVLEKRFAATAKAATVVVNAAVANAGRAAWLEHGPTVLRVRPDADESENENVVEILDPGSRFGSSDDVRTRSFGGRDDDGGRGFYDTDAAADDDENENNDVGSLLLAVDLGLRSGAALYDDEGRLLRYEQLHFQRSTLEAKAEELLERWEREARDGDDGRRRAITRVAIEGAEPRFVEAWTNAARARNAVVGRVSPEEWRAGLLSPRERRKGHEAKAAARLIARQVVADRGVRGRPHGGRFPTDAAEAVVMGYHVVRRLGWGDTAGPAVRRYTNGRVVVAPTPTPV